MNNILKQKDIEFTIVDFHKKPIYVEKLLELSSKLKMSLNEMLRTGESIYKELNLKNKKLTDSELAKIMIDNPNLMQRPIIETTESAIIARPPADIVGFIDSLS